MTHIGIVGHEAGKFTCGTEDKAREIIRDILLDKLTLVPPEQVVLISGGCHLGGIDIWAEEEADKLCVPKIIYLPAKHQWSGGYKERNILIAKTSDEVHNITVAEYPPIYHGMRFDRCYHCEDVQWPGKPVIPKHIKSGGCWTARYAAVYYKKPAFWHII